MQPYLMTFLIIATVFDAGLIGFAVTRQDRMRSLPFAALSAVLLVYALGYLLEIMADTADEVMVALKIENFGIPLIAPFFLLVMLSLFKLRRIRAWMMVLPFLYGFGMFLCVLFNDYHRMYYTSITMIYDGASYFAMLGRGPLYALQQALSISMMLAGYIVVIVGFVRGNKKLRSQMIYPIVGSIVAFCANIANFSGLLPVGLDPTPFALTFGLFLMSVSVFKHRMLDIITLSSNLAVETMSDAIIALDNEWNYVFSNLSAKEIFPALAAFSGTEDMRGHAWWPPELLPREEAGQVAFSCSVGGKKSDFRANISRITGGWGRQIGWSIVIRDISDITGLMAQLEELATRDELTGALNRRHFLSLVEKELNRATRQGMTIALIMYDLDHFKEVNDTYGHAAGDYVLRAVTETVGSQLREYDLFARYGGEEFLISAVNGSDDSLRAISTRLCAAIERTHIVFNGITIPITASFGATSIPPGGSFDEALLAVDRAMYQAKDEGRNRVVLSTAGR